MTRLHNLVGRDGVRVMAERCDSCIFEPGAFVGLRPGRLAELVKEARSDPSGSIVCHKTLDDREHAVCRGFFETCPTPMLQLAAQMNFIRDFERTPPCPSST